MLPAVQLQSRAHEPCLAAGSSAASCIVSGKMDNLLVPCRLPDTEQTGARVADPVLGMVGCRQVVKIVHSTDTRSRFLCSLCYNRYTTSSCGYLSFACPTAMLASIPSLIQHCHAGNWTNFFSR